MSTITDIAQAELDQWQRQVNAETVRNQAALIRKLEAVLREIVHEYENTYDASIEPGDLQWHAAASIPVEVMERAKRLCE